MLNQNSCMRRILQCKITSVINRELRIDNSWSKKRLRLLCKRLGTSWLGGSKAKKLKSELNLNVNNKLFCNYWTQIRSTLPKPVKLLRQLAISGLSDRLLCNNWSVYVRFKIIDCFLKLEGIFNDLLLTSFSLDAHLKDFVDYLLKIFDKVIVRAALFIRLLVDDGDEDFPIVSDCPSKSL